REAVPFSGTNVQEAGVDEPDIIKSDGRRIVAIANAQLLVIDVTGPAPVLRGRLGLEGSGHQLLVRDDTALVMATVAPGAPDSPALPSTPPASPRQAAGTAPASPSPSPPVLPPSPSPGIGRPDLRGATRLVEVALDDPAKPTVRRSLTLDGALVDARLTQGTARVVVTSPPRALDAGDVEDAGLRTWVPKTVLRSRVTGRTFERSVVPCDDVRRPKAFSGLDLLSVLTIDLDRGLFSVDRDAVLAGAQTVYASPDSLYVASRPYSRAVEAGTGAPDDVRTQIHRYDARGTSATTYRATGDVPGFVLNQYAMSEHQDRLRVATTSEPLWFGDGTATESESRVTVLGEDAGRLNTVGSVGGLGKGERIYAVRFLGDRGYVVTFRRTDPLYTLDLSDPTAPRVRGELKILGYSAYLHPVGEDRLLGVGQDATERGQATGAQLSLFDVSDAAAPKRVAQAALGSGTSTRAEFDPHAFLFWDPTRLGVIPVERYGAADQRFTGAIGFRVGRDALSEVGRLAHPARQGVGAPPIGRSLVIGARLYTLSYDGLQAANLADLVPVGFTPFS
ncbi:MAG: beta-propeller domain-containing protein, partial [Actinomycetota bacterium]|nr:beta-propeller domain-containing protein [Actinomycetota bacterium]